MGKHTREPWAAHTFEKRGRLELRATGVEAVPMRVMLPPEDYDRAMACVNACAGIANPAALGELVEAAREVALRLEESAGGGRTIRSRQSLRNRLRVALTALREGRE